MPMKYNTVSSNWGNNLSGGQRQKNAIARALLKKPQLLILDDATSYLDTISEDKISKELEKTGCTRIIFAHRLSTVRRADFIYVLDRGNIIEKGNHKDLLKLKGEYYELYSKCLVDD